MEQDLHGQVRYLDTRYEKDKNMKKLCVFPGQGASFLADVQNFYKKSQIACEMFSRARDVLGEEFFDLFMSGDPSLESQTSFVQPALYAYCAALFKEFKNNYENKLSAFAGLSLGEFTALHAGGWLDFEEGLLLTSKRGELMKSACCEKNGAMFALLGTSLEVVEKTIKDFTRFGCDVWISNHNTPTQLVIAGRKEVLEAVAPVLKHRGTKKIIPLNVEGAFHTPYMASVEHEFSTLIEKTAFKDSESLFFSNRYGDQLRCVDEIKASLVYQLTHTVHFSVTIANAANLGYCPHIIGPKQPLKSLVSQNTDIEVTSTSSIESIYDTL